jgi:hypothetical protein
LDEHKKERIFKIQEEDVHSLAPKKTIWPFGGQFKGPFNIFSNNPSFSNQFGSLFEVGPSESKCGLEGLNLMLSFANITKVYITTNKYNIIELEIHFCYLLSLILIIMHRDLCLQFTTTHMQTK